jgi:Tfp pilus assembly protein PilE
MNVTMRYDRRGSWRELNPRSGAVARPSGSPRGLTTIEMVMATLVLGVAMTLTVQILGWVMRERRGADRRAIAVQEAANAMERLAAQPWDQLTPEAAQSEPLSPAALQALPGAELNVTVAAEADKPGLKRIGVQLRWRGRSSAYEAPVRLTSWVARRGRAQP